MRSLTVLICLACVFCCLSARGETSPVPGQTISQTEEGAPMSASRSDCLTSSVVKMNLDGYIGYKVNGFLRNWALDAVRANPEMIEAIDRVNRGGNPHYTPYNGAPLEQGVFAGMHLAGLAFCYLASGSEEILKEGEKLVDLLSKAQGANGYLGTSGVDTRFGGDGLTTEDSNKSWDMWCFYHSIHGLYQWHRATGSRLALDMAVREADLCIAHFVNRDYLAGFPTVNMAVGHAFALLYQATGDEKYLSESIRIVEKEWSKQNDWLNKTLQGIEFYEMGTPRWETLHSVMALATLYEITSEKQYFDAYAAIWRSLEKGDRHNNGGLTTGEKIIGDPYAEGAIETCCNIAWAAYGIDYLRLSRDSRAADELELTYYNALLGCLTENLREVTYDNPMDGKNIKSQIPLSWFNNSGTPDMNCCQANACRAIGEVSRWAAMTDQQALYLNFYSPCAITAKTPSGRAITLRIGGDYPLSGGVTVTAEGLESEETFDLMLRIPCWSKETTASVNGAPIDGIEAGQYVRIHRTWQNGDCVALDLDMSLHFWAGEGRLEGKTSVYYGPILMALDQNVIGMPPQFVHLRMSDLSEAVPVGGDGEILWIALETKALSGSAVRLIDYASAGKTGGLYNTWLQIYPAPTPSREDSSGVPIWTARP